MGGVKANTYSYELFYNLQNLKEIDLTYFSISYAKRITNMFYNCKELTSIDVSNFDTSNVIKM